MPEPVTRARQRTTTKAGRVPAPFSPAAAKLIEQIQADARATLLEELSAKDGVTVLPPLDAATRRVRHEGNLIIVTDSRGAEYHSHRDHSPDQHNRYSSLHPAVWLASRTLIDGAGNAWNNYLGRFVCDDFGNLVGVAQ